MKIYEIIDIDAEDSWFKARKTLLGRKIKGDNIYRKQYRGAGWYYIELIKPIPSLEARIFYMVKLRQVKE